MITLVPTNSAKPQNGTTYHSLGHNEGEDIGQTHNEFSRVMYLVEIWSRDSELGNTHV